MKNYFSMIEKSERWDNEMDILKQVANMIEEKEIISKSSCYYPRLTDTKKRGRVAFIELYKKLCLAENDCLMSINNFELFVCKHKDWVIHIQPTDRWGPMCAEWILELDLPNPNSDDLLKYLYEFEFLKTPDMPSITTKEEKIDNLQAIKNLASNLEITGEEAIQILKYFLAGLEQLSQQGDSP